MKHKKIFSTNDLCNQMAQISRRDFIKRSVATGAAFGLPPFLLSCGGNSSSDAPITETRTLFFNLAHEQTDGKTYFLVAGDRNYQLTCVSDAPHVLKKARATNTFLGAIPDNQITHHIQNITLASDSVTLCYIGSPLNNGSGAWAMSMLYLNIPDSGARHAFQEAKIPLHLSNKREFYNQPAARTAKDLRDENALIDSHNHAASLVMLIPDLLSGEPNSAHYIYTNHVGTGSPTKKLANTLRSLGPAMPQQSPGQPNAQGWATMKQLSDIHGASLINPNNNLIQYFPDWHQDVDLDAANAMVVHINNTKNDPVLGVTVNRGTTASSADFSGKIWFRREGFTTVDSTSTQSAAIKSATGGDTVAMQFLDQSPENGLDITGTISASGGKVIADIKLSNSYLRYLGVYLQFLDDKNPPNILPLSEVQGYPFGIIANHDRHADTDTTMFASIIEPELTIFAVPTAPGIKNLSITVPQNASRIRILCSGLSFSGRPNSHGSAVLNGAAMTAFIDYGVNLLFMAAGTCQEMSDLQMFVVRPVMDGLALELAEFILAGVKDPSEIGTAEFWKNVAITLGEQVAQSEAKIIGAIFPAVVVAIVGIIGTGIVANGVPIFNAAWRAISALVGVADLEHTSADLFLSPWTYVKDLVLTHDLSVTLLPDPNSPGFPKAANQYKVTAMFEDGTPYVQTYTISNGPTTLLPVVFKNVPLGGKANVSVAFSQQGADDILLGKGTTGLIDNIAGAQPVITIEELKFPINANTVYQHQQKTTLAADPHGGPPVHVWATTKIPPATTNTDNGNQPGDLSVLESITVRQGTSRPPLNGYIGYSWRAFSSGVADCNSGAVTQLDQVVNLNSLSAQAQTGYIATRCGLPSGVKVAYSLLSHNSTNFYLDTSINPKTNAQRNLIRRIQLDPNPHFDDPNSNLAWGKLNFTSTALLLHPAGKLVSISVTDHQIETLKIPAASLADDQAAEQLCATRHGGQGNLPGLLSAPTAAAISPDGVLLVLEQGNNRIQAFDVNGNPVRYFTGQSQPYFLNLTATQSGDIQYLDLAVEFTGFLYVLSYNQTSRRYQMDIYHPKQTGTAPISTTVNMNAGRLTVDFWRNVYTLNFEVLQLNGTFPAVTEPSVSLWTPCAVGNVC